ncbi:E3 SUMO-protein ligase ZBED1-like [Diabrotica undecimpunctata]|uniref:E3 SUMO-protein ligase ZBED1-like n=1 Tax=Diabrotica undecimpunctata TaxID=50387 RepID=UPI003B637E7D
MSKKSEIWNFFSDEDNSKAKCNICKSVFSYRTSVTNLKAHITRKHPSVRLCQFERGYNRQEKHEQQENPQIFGGSSTHIEGAHDIGVIPATVITDSSLPSTSRASSSSSGIIGSSRSEVRRIQQQVLSAYAPKRISMTQQKKLDQLLLNLIIKDFQPFSIVEDNGFKDFILTLNPAYKLPTRKTLSNVLLPAVFEEVRLKVSDVLKEVVSITITTDCWTSRNTDSVIAVTGHFIDNKFQIKSVLLECVGYEGGHGSTNLADNLTKVISNWNISEESILLGISDNAANIKKYISSDLKWRHFGCYVHTLNLIVGDALKLIQEVTLNKVSKIVTHFKQSANAKNKLDNVQRQQGKEPKKLKKDVVTRWNSTYLMLERFVELEEAIRTTLALMDSVSLPVIPTEEWTFIKELIIILKPFYDITELMSAEKYVTLSLVIVITNGLKNVCNDMLSSNQFSNDISKRVIEKLIESITFRLGNLESSITLIVSTFLDPRFKNVCFIKPGTFDKAKEIVIGLVAQNIKANSTSNEDVMMEVESANTSRTLESETEKPLFDIWKQLNKSVSSQPKLNQSPQARAIVEVNHYLEEEMIHRNEDPLKWWANNASVFPNLSHVVRSRFGTTRKQNFQKKKQNKHMVQQEYEFMLNG